MNLLITTVAIVMMLAFALIARIWKPSWMNSLFWIAAWWIALYLVLKYAIAPPLPGSIVQMFMAIISIALLFYISSDTAILKEVMGSLTDFLVEKKYRIPLTLVTVLLPLLVAWRVYAGMQVEVVAPVFGRSIHPAPPTQITYEGRQILLAELENPYRKLEVEDPDRFMEHVQNGRNVYYNNCVLCHGDTLEGNGLFAHGFNPIPANLADSGTIAQLQENYVFWRIAKGGPGLPDESGPWSSAMPAWEKFLPEEEIWDVTMFIYHFTNSTPRADLQLAH